MPLSKILSENNLEKVESSSEFLNALVTFTGSMLNSTSSLLQKHWFKSVCFPLTFVLGLLTHLFIVINFIKLENKNLGSTSKLILSIISTILTLIAVVCFFVSNYPLAVGLCLLASIGLGALFNSSLFIYSVYQMIQLSATEKNKDLKAIYKSKMTAQQEIPTLHSSIESVSLVCEYERLIDNLNSLVMNKQTENAISFQYYKNKNRRQHLTKDLAKNRAYLLMEIFEKIKFLECEIEKNKEKLGEWIWIQEEKRLEKIDLLVSLVVFYYLFAKYQLRIFLTGRMRKYLSVR